MAFDRQPQFARLAFDDARQVAFGGGNLRQQVAGKLEQALAGRSETQRGGFAFEQGGVVVVFEGADLVREGGLGQENALGGKGDAAGFFQRQQGFEVAQFDDGVHVSDGLTDGRRHIKIIRAGM